MSDHTFETLKLLYEENAKVAAIFWEWRHKSMVSFFAGITGLFAFKSAFVGFAFSWEREF